MNKIIASLIIGFGFFFLSLNTQQVTAQSQDEIIQSIQEGSSSDLASYFNSSIALNINNNSGDFSKNQAELIFRDFFRKFPPQSFEVIRQGEATEPLWYFIGNYRSEQDIFRVLIKGKSENETLGIYSIDFSKDQESFR